MTRAQAATFAGVFLAAFGAGWFLFGAPRTSRQAAAPHAREGARRPSVTIPSAERRGEDAGRGSARPEPSSTPEPSASRFLAADLGDSPRTTDDAPRLLASFRSDPSIARFGALRSYFTVTGPDGLSALVPDFASTQDPRVIAILGDAFGAGGTEALAEALTAKLSELDSPTKRLWAVRAALEIAERSPLSAPWRLACVAALEGIASATPDLSRDACAALAAAGSHGGAQALARIALRVDLPGGTRFTAAEALLPLDPRTAVRALRTLAETAQDAAVRQASAALLSANEH